MSTSKAPRGYFHWPRCIRSRNPRAPRSDNYFPPREPTRGKATKAPRMRSRTPEQSFSDFLVSHPIDDRPNTRGVRRQRGLDSVDPAQDGLRQHKAVTFVAKRRIAFDSGVVAIWLQSNRDRWFRATIHDNR